MDTLLSGWFIRDVLAGTGTGQLLEHLHSSLDLPLSRLLGLSAVDHREGKTLPDSSYRITNIDLLAGSLGEAKFDLILSFSTFYHLVDPLGALPAVYSLLAPGGLALLSHVPLEAAVQAAGPLSYLGWNR